MIAACAGVPDAPSSTTPAASGSTTTAERPQLAALASTQNSHTRLLREIKAKIDEPRPGETLAEIVALQRQQLEILKRLERERDRERSSSTPPASDATPPPTQSPAVLSTAPRGTPAPSIYGRCLANCAQTDSNSVTCSDQCACQIRCENEGDPQACAAYCRSGRK